MAPMSGFDCFSGGLFGTKAMLVVFSIVSVSGRGRLLGKDRAPLHTQGRFIVDRLGERVKWACVNHQGAESQSMVPGGMEIRPVEEIAILIFELGFNCIRLPYSVQATIENPVIKDEFLRGNPRLKGKRFMDVLEATVNAFTNVGLMVVLDNHNSKAGWCCFPSQDQGLWYTPGFPTDVWIESLVNQTAHFRSNPLVVGHSVRNEVHDYGGVQLTWGDGNPKTDWHMMATLAGNKVLEANPDVLVVINGVCSGICLNPVRDLPIVLDVPHRVVYEAHNYVEYQYTNLIPRNIISWNHLRNLLLTLVGIWVLAAGKTAVDWRSQDRPKLPGKCVWQTVGWWVFGAGVLRCLLVGVTVFVWTRMGCHWWAHNVVLTWLFYPTLLAACGLLTALYGIFGSGCGDVMFRQGSQCDSDVELIVGGQTQQQQRLVSFSGDEQVAFWNPWRIQISFGGFVLSGFLIYIVHCVNLFSSYEWTRLWQNDLWGFVLEEGQPFTAPVWIGEFGYLNHGPYWLDFVHYLSETDVDFGYWSLNGLKYGEGWLDSSTGEFVFWAGCDTLKRPMEGTSCQAQLGVWAAEGRDDIFDGVYFKNLPDACVNDVATNGTCHDYCARLGRKCLKGSPKTNTCVRDQAAGAALLSDGCEEDLQDQICVCTRQLWVWDNETFGLLNADYRTLRAAWLLRDLQALAESPSSWVPRDLGCPNDIPSFDCTKGQAEVYLLGDAN
eukprot:TRINITY_DN24292_c0_g1_i1.p1 TRINITY_DN24292_c0_g1~~TRINITY_DN24292_c0_g1_i1.p1  ORF type:complete len:720 (-),score=76.45 TRINITY_DN24292_c0_g1_i1:328-2487(-)